MLTSFYCLTLLALFGQVELFKLGLLTAPPQSDQYGPGEYYTGRQQYATGYQQHHVYAGERPPQPLAPVTSYQQPYQPPALAYVIVRPIAPSYPYYDSSMRYYAPLHQPTSFGAQQDYGVKGVAEPERQPTYEQATKGDSRPEYIKQEKLEDSLLVQQHQLAEPAPALAPEGQQLYDMGKGKLLKIKSTLNKLAASAKSKLAQLGTKTSYYVTGEEIVPPAVPAQPLRQEQLHTSDIQLTKLEQQHIEDAGQTKLETQQQLEDVTQTKFEDTRETKLDEGRVTKLEENRGTKLEDTRQTKLEEVAPVINQVKLEDTRQTKLEEVTPAINQVKLEETRQEKLTEKEPLREKETKGIEQAPLQQERYENKGLQQGRYDAKELQQERHDAKGFQQERHEVKGLHQQQQPLQQERHEGKGIQQQQLPLQQERYEAKGLHQQQQPLQQERHEGKGIQQQQLPLQQERYEAKGLHQQQQPLQQERHEAKGLQQQQLPLQQERYEAKGLYQQQQPLRDNYQQENLKAEARDQLPINGHQPTVYFAANQASDADAGFGRRQSSI